MPKQCDSAHFLVSREDYAPGEPHGEPGEVNHEAKRISPCTTVWQLSIVLDKHVCFDPDLEISQ